MLKEKGFSPYQGLLQAIWSDERITATCVSMRNTDQIRENVAAARDFGKSGPLKLSQIEQLRDACDRPRQDPLRRLRRPLRPGRRHRPPASAT